MKKKNVSASNEFTPFSLRETIFAFQKSRIILTAYELGVFTALGTKKKTSAQVASLIKADTRATDRLMNALCAIGLLNKSSSLFANTSFSARYLVKGQPDYLTGLLHGVGLWNTWSTLTEAVQKGRTVMDWDDDKDTDQQWVRGFIGAMHERAKQSAPALIAMLDLNGVRRVLDVGGGSGVYAMAFVQANKNIKATVFDLPEVIPVTKDYIRKAGLSGRIDTETGDFNKDNLGRGFDLVFLSAIIHSVSPQQNLKLVAKSAKALNPGGRLVIVDFVMDDDRTSPAHGAIFALNMLVGTKSGDTYTESEIRNWMRTSKLVNITRQDTPFNTSLITGYK